MRKILTYLLILTMLISLIGCGESEAEGTTASTSPNTSPAENAETTPTEVEPAPVKQQPMIAVTLPVSSGSVNAEDGSSLFIYREQSMELIVQDSDVALQITGDFSTRTEIQGRAQSMIDSAKNAFSAGNATLPYWTQIQYTPQRLDRSILSLYGYDVMFDGSTHTTTIYCSVTYDLLKGNVLTLTDILTPKTDMDTVCTLVIDALCNQPDPLFPGYEDMVSTLFKSDDSIQANWYFNRDGLCFYFPPYEIGPYTSGDIVAVIPYSKLPGILLDAYFPPEQDISTGTIVTTNFDGTTLDTFTQTAEVILDSTGKKVLLYTDSSVQDIRIMQQMPALGDASYLEPITVFAAAALTPGDAVVIQLPVNAVVTVTYRSGSEIHTQSIS